MDTQRILNEYEALFAPKTVAVVGASTKGTALPNVFIRRIREFGYEGTIYPIHPTAAEIDGLTAYKSLGATPQPVDYAYIAIAAAQVPPLLAAGKGRVRFAQVISSGFGEVDEGKRLQEELAISTSRSRPSPRPTTRSPLPQPQRRSAGSNPRTPRTSASRDRTSDCGISRSPRARRR